MCPMQEQRGVVYTYTVPRGVQQVVELQQVVWGRGRVRSRGGAWWWGAYGVGGSMVFRSLTAWRKKLLQNLADRVLMLWNLLLSGRRANRLCEGGALKNKRLCVHRDSERWCWVEGREIPTIFSAVLTMLCQVLHFDALQVPKQWFSLLGWSPHCLCRKG